MTRSSARPLAVVTAGARRLGRAICLRLAEHGFDVALHFHTSKEQAAIVKQEIEALGRQCALFQCDLSQTNEVQALIPSIREECGNPVLLVNNASVFEKNSLLTATPEAFDVNVNLHVKAPFFLIQNFAKGQAEGQVINLVDTSVTRETTDYFTYLLSKKNLLDLTRMAAKELAPGIRVNAIAPGIILPPPGIDRAVFEKELANNPLQRAAGSKDVLRALDYLLEAPQVTGQCLFVDGGDHISW